MEKREITIVAFLSILDCMSLDAIFEDPLIDLHSDKIRIIRI